MTMKIKTDSLKNTKNNPLVKKEPVAPTPKSWDSWFDGESVTSDFMDIVEQPDEQDRESL
ncbi:hypothetical protein [Leminorella grimontii]|uniref:hypothetical protein n=1 Tax=Leminorella grimontii TaxID=82981 RepID=UPI00208502DC|nr:hypothetical protein [Leminorella grimontii]GKX58554.1 hypothetical protein SOASR031_08690 [Leminorella grimontii]